MAERITGKRRILAPPLMFAFALCATLFASAVAFAANPTLYYMEADGTTKTCTDYRYLTEETITANGNTLAPGWWAVDSTFTHDDCLIMGSGADGVNLVLVDGSKLTVTGGICVPEDGGLVIYAGSPASDIEGSGALDTKGDSSHAAGIGPLEQGGTNGAITINGGTVSARGASGGAGIGGFRGPGKYITINGGTVNATGGAYGAGIGGAGASADLPSGVTSDGEFITINGGVVTAKGGSSAAGIGGGNRSGAGRYITINGGTVETMGNNGGAGIGGGGGASTSAPGGTAGYITINGGNITATGSVATGRAAGIGAGQNATAQTGIVVTENALYKVINAFDREDREDPNSVVAPGARATTFSAGSEVFFIMTKVAGTQTVTASPVQATFGDTGVTVQASVSGNMEGQSCGALSYALKNDAAADVVTVDASTGALTILKNGTTIVVVTAAATGFYPAATAEVQVNIAPAKVDPPAAVTGLVYSAAVFMGVSVGFSAPYTLTGGVVTAIDAGNYEATFTPYAGYEWSDSGFSGTVAWSIAKADMSSVTVAAIGAQEYTGAAVEPAVTVTLGDRTLAAGNYDISYGSNIGLGQATVTLTGKGNMQGTKTVYFRIVCTPAEQAVEKIAAIGQVEYTDASKAKIDAARAAYDALSDDLKGFVTADQLAVLTDAEAAYEALKPGEGGYQINDGKWTQGSGATLAFEGEGPLSRFLRVEVDGETVDPDNYILTEGSTIATFSPDYLGTLAVGTHALTMVWDDGTANGTLTIVKQTIPSSADGTGMFLGLLAGILALAAAGAALAAFRLQRRRG